ncbi:DNA processing protein DprA [Ktedonobacter sp. SOSP1-52]|uniref:DNA-processing protein DprA n=1 Tax=Ktedonobacter sp. SOSP1-52 TaxID=2778366 RepID=UPI001915742E|nr:DNA-processing protein DprA [Ktedonobacter sp. SOSP1-52]GHO66307.1 DNA processing protein DprA [Ktedonobacter sp. SOSP1-52]
MEVHEETPQTAKQYSKHYYPSETLPLKQLMHWIAFSRVMGIGAVRFRLLEDYFQGDMQAAWQAGLAELCSAGLDEKTAEKFLHQRTSIVPEQELERLEKRRMRVITWRDQEYPPLLSKFEYAPPVLYIYGHLNEDDQEYALGIVGTRRMTSYGRQVTEKLTTELTGGRVTIVSGLALGVDTVAHTTALDTGGRTIAVLASGLDTIYPPSNRALAKRIIESGQGALISAFPLGVRPDAGNFPARNHLIAGLSLGVLVTEAPARSGALITASSALQQGREVFGVPHSIFSPGGEGVNKLIQDGAHLVTRVEDIIERLNIYMLPQHIEAKRELPANAEEESLLALLNHESKHIDEITRESGLPASSVTATLTMLQLKGLVKDMGAMHYILVS